MNTGVHDNLQRSLAVLEARGPFVFRAGSGPVEPLVIKHNGSSNASDDEWSAFGPVLAPLQFVAGLVMVHLPV